MTQTKRDQTHEEFTKRWIQTIKENKKNWREIHAQFINAQFENANKIIEKLSKTPEGREKLVKLHKIGNKKGYPKIFNP